MLEIRGRWNSIFAVLLTMHVQPSCAGKDVGEPNVNILQFNSVCREFHCRLGAQRPAKRFLRETKVLVNPKSKSLGSISVKVCTSMPTTLSNMSLHTCQV